MTNYYSKIKQTNKYTRSFNYTGNKHRVLPIILKLMPSNINKFYDLMCGSGAVGLNVAAKEIVFNDLDKNSIDLLKHCYEAPLQNILDYMQANMPTSKEEFLKLKQNKNHILDNYLLKKVSLLNEGSTFRIDRDWVFNRHSRNKYTNLINLLKGKNIIFSNSSFELVEIEQNNNNYVYFDPPYITTAKSYKYNFAVKDSVKLANLFQDLHSKNIKFGLSCSLFTTKGYDLPIIQAIQNNKFIVHAIDLINNLVFKIDDIEAFFSEWLKKGKVDKYEMFVTNYQAL